MTSFDEGCLGGDLENHKISLLLEILEDDGQSHCDHVIFPVLRMKVHTAFGNKAINSHFLVFPS